MTRLRRVLDPSRTGKEAESLERTLLKLVVGQEAAVEQIVNIYQMHITGLSAPGRPVGNFLFLGPTGSGKTRTVEATAEALAHNRNAVIKIDCGEFQHSHEIAKLIGSPPGYLGHRETHPLLSQEVINQHHTESMRLSFILFDEIEKASDALWNLLLGILDKATLTLGDNRKVDFSRCLIFMTSNLGSSEMNALLNPKHGFQRPVNNNPSGPIDEDMAKKMARSGIEAARRKFTPEFMNRIDKVVVFKPLGEPELRRILDLELAYVQQLILLSAAEKPFVFTVSPAGKNLLLEEGTDVKYGARHLKRAIWEYVMHPLSNLIATNQVNTGDWIEADVNPDVRGLRFTPQAEGLELHTMARMMGDDFRLPQAVAAAVAQVEPSKTVSAKSSKK
jgi:ATP-dependent Clp protease ATP-binding subunit ClpA